MREKSTDKGQRPKRQGSLLKAEGFARGSGLEIGHSPSLAQSQGC